MSDSVNPAPLKKKPAAIVILTLLAISVLVLVFSIAYYLGSDKTTASGSSDTPVASQSDRPADSSERQSDQLPQGVTAVTEEQGKKVIKSFYRNDKADPRAIGDPKAPVTMIQFSDFSCPMCYQYESAVFPQLKPYIDNGTLRIEFNNLSIFASQYHSDLGAAGSIAAAKQGKFWEYLLNATKVAAQDGNGHITWDKQLVTQVAQASGVSDLARFNQDLAAGETATTIENESSHAHAVGLSGTPAFFINNYVITGALPADSFIQTIEIAAKTAKTR
ncbi:thioredoxin domain-containing protein [Varibaculum cambriense]|mgnify:CR=1 FL=1|uniref:DsbA family protein n=1 Tax=Varibaculum cambriense TaxID=184870 RepID=UPI000C7B6C49|nr:thioredoxin domain-containing protein [Varibaculum cambriense]WIK88647.1 thioredoxin domain-containing protein [Varibaculum cambriense]